MLIKFQPNFSITPNIATNLMKIEAMREKIINLPLTPSVLISLRETARLFTTHYSTMIEGNRLSPGQIEEVLTHKGHFPGRERDEREIKGYYSALKKVEQLAALNTKITENIIQTIHALVMESGKTNIKPSPYRDGQNVIHDSQTRSIVYMPPEAKDVPGLMKGLVEWINNTKNLPYPIVAGIAHYQFATIHPYYDVNVRTARLLTTLVLHLGSYDLKGLYSLEEYYARNLGAYYEALSVGYSHNYYMGRAEADITHWVEYFIQGMAISFEKVLDTMSKANIRGEKDQTATIRKLDPRQRKVIELFKEFDKVTSSQIGGLFGFKARTSSQICKNWVEEGFLEIVVFSNKGRKYSLSPQFKPLTE